MLPAALTAKGLSRQPRDSKVKIRKCFSNAFVHSFSSNAYGSISVTLYFPLFMPRESIQLARISSPRFDTKISDGLRRNNSQSNLSTGIWVAANSPVLASTNANPT